MGLTSLVIGGGFFGMYLAEHLAHKGHNVRLVEQGVQFMSRASYSNQARVHNGYHYPRSVLTALRSRVSFPRFSTEFLDCIDSEFDKFYLIGKPLGKVSAKQFLKFCDRIGAKCEVASDKMKSLTNPAMIEECFSVVEYAFDAIKLRDIMIQRIDETSVNCSLNTSVERVIQHGNGLQVDLFNNKSQESETEYADHVFNCTYSRINYVNAKSGLDLIPLKHEMTEICLVDVPEELKNVGITVMCGPFFSVMPFPPESLHSFSHVRYTPHFEWKDGDESEYEDAYIRHTSTKHHSAWRYMQNDAERYIPILSECVYRKSLWEVKTVLPSSEIDDSRPILFLPHYKLKGFHCIMGGKIDNVYEVIDAIASTGLIK
jgi:FAD dependent oxidoreductase